MIDFTMKESIVGYFGYKISPIFINFTILVKSRISFVQENLDEQIERGAFVDLRRFWLQFLPCSRKERGNNFGSCLLQILNYG